MSRRSIKKNIAFSGVVAAGLWLGAEGCVSTLYKAELLAWESPPASPQKGVPVMQGNPYLLYEYPPGTHQERGVTVEINSLGLRGPEPAMPKPDGMVRLISTGDSSIFGFGVEHTETFTTVAADRLNEGGGPTVDPVIGAIPGYSTFQSINLLTLRGLKTDPDLFVIANLWSDNNFDSFVDKEVLAQTTGFQDSLVARMRGVLSRSAVFRVIDWRLRVKGSVERVQEVGWMQKGRGQIGPRRVEINDYAANLDRLVEMAEERDADVVFVLPANNEDMGSETGDKAWDPYRAVMRETAQRHGAPLVDVPAVFQASGRARGELFLDEMHPTVAGHRLMGEALAQTLADAGWPQGRLAMDGTGAPRPTYEDPFTQGSAAASGPGGSGAPAGSATGGLRLSGTVVCGDCGDKQMFLEALKPDGGNTPVVLGQACLPPGTTEFSIQLGRIEAVVVRGYEDTNGDCAPSAGEPPIDLSSTVIPLDDDGRDGVVVNLDERSVEL